ncbi:nitroreductase [Segniliparus rotundus DSM 44985]|uniref:Nitroreductase n=1 Tax=Segniliparus rotundus (strain ATCC BAA-972 / CDC 1076 / CIP 108378 / DSM 44985 / JCM 13578) TaxID=640132 RepID=D6ZAC2_SEGRD|nr:nitroreductase [Segniliparus rotundus]ADG96664.1 nitroreductase [Segniliparus rotundus DSM 44985]
MAEILDFSELVRARHSVRAFLPEPLSKEELDGVLGDAQRSPSNSNTQPWRVHIVSGAKRDELRAALLDAAARGETSLDFSFDPKYGQNEVLLEHMRQFGQVYYETMGVSRDDAEGRSKLMLRNLGFFNAPHVAFLFLPVVGDSVRVAADIGMYAQTFLLSLVARGFGGIPQTMLGHFANTVREVLGISEEHKLLFGISFGRPDESALENSFRVDRTPVEHSVVLHS